MDKADEQTGEVSGDSVDWERAYRELEEQTARMLRGVSVVMSRLERQVASNTGTGESGPVDGMRAANEIDRLRRDAAEREKKVTWLRSRVKRASESVDELKGKNRQLEAEVVQQSRLVAEFADHLHKIQEIRGDQAARS